MSEYIKREDALNGLAETMLYKTNGDNEVAYMLRDIPSADVVEVVRCKDCKHWQAKPNEDEEDNENNGFATWYDCDKTCHICGNGNDYCSYGERKDEDNA